MFDMFDHSIYYKNVIFYHQQYLLLMTSSQEESVSEDLLEKEQIKIKKQLKNVPYSVLLKMIQGDQQSQKIHKNKNTTQKVKKIHSLAQTRLNVEHREDQINQKDKNQPKQIKIRKKPLKRQFKPLFESSKRRGIDPRFQDYAGNYNRDLAMKSYSFVPKIQNNEISQLKETLKKGKVSLSQRQILMKNYNQLTSDAKRLELTNLEKQVYRKNKITYKADRQLFYKKKKQLKQQFDKQKIMRLSQVDRERMINKKTKNIRKGKLIERKTAIKP